MWQQNEELWLVGRLHHCREAKNIFILRDNSKCHRWPTHYQVSGCKLATYLNWKTLFEWCVVCMDLRMDAKKVSWVTKGLDYDLEIC